MVTTAWRVQHGFAVRFDWALAGLSRIVPEVSVIVIVDVLRFTTAVSVAVERGCAVYPSPWQDGSAETWARERGIAVAGLRDDGSLSLSPTDLGRMDLPERLLLPSPNGSALTVAAKEQSVPHVLAGCLRNAVATAARAIELADGGSVAVIAAGELSRDGSMRPAIEDLLGAGAIISALDRMAPWSPEAVVAAAAFDGVRATLSTVIGECASARELAGHGFADDVAIASELDTSNVAAELRDGAYVRVRASGRDVQPDR